MMMLSNSRTGSAAAGASTKENPRRKFATGSAGLALVVRGSSRRIMIMRFRPANISLINRRHYLPRLLLTLSSKYNDKKQPQRFADIDRVTPYQFTGCGDMSRMLFGSLRGAFLCVRPEFMRIVLRAVNGNRRAPLNPRRLPGSANGLDTV
jgi:hypothetical protein